MSIQKNLFYYQIKPGLDSIHTVHVVPLVQAKQSAIHD
jgi:hypothetical protein